MNGNLIQVARLVSHSVLSQFITEKSNLKEEGFIFGSQFQILPSMVNWLHCFRPEMRQNMMVAGACVTSRWPGSKNRKGLWTR
jgi:hypothetical protein